MRKREPGHRTSGAAMALAAAALLALGGCGQPGPLYLPPEKSSLSAADPAPVPGSAPLPAAAARPGALRPVPVRPAHG